MKYGCQFHCYVVTCLCLINYKTDVCIMPVITDSGKVRILYSLENGQPVGDGGFMAAVCWSVIGAALTVI